MRCRTDAGSRVVEFVGIGLGARDQLGNRIDAGFGTGQNHVRRGPEFGDRRKILVRIIRNFGVKTGIDDIGTRCDQQRVAIRLGMRRGADPDIAAGTRLVLDDNSTADGLAEMDAEDTRHDVGRSGRRERHDDPDGTLGIPCRPRLPQTESWRDHRPHREADRAQKLAAR
jgi:hypothetical protein